MNWLVFALISSVTLSLREVSVKKASKGLSPAWMSVGMNLIMFLMILSVNVVMVNWPEIDTRFIQILLIASILDSLATVLYLGSIKYGDLSKSIPMLCFIPVVQLFVTPFLVKEQLTATGILGVGIVVFGSYLLNLEKSDSFWAPIKRVGQNRSSLMMLSVAIIWGVSSSFHKIGVNQTNAIFWGVCEIGLISFILLFYALIFDKNRMSLSFLKPMIAPSIFSTLAVLSYYIAISLGPIAYVSSVRRLGVLFSMLIGILLLNETYRKPGVAGGMIMIGGAAIISLYG